jgi:phage baseplate assembly protein W
MITLQKLNKPIYIDINFHFDGVDDQFLIADLEAINGQFYNLFTTYRGEADGEPTFGCLLLDILYEPIDAITASDARMDIYQAVDEWMKSRVTIDLRDILVEPIIDDRGYKISVYYSLPNLNNSFSYTAEIRG